MKPAFAAALISSAVFSCAHFGPAPRGPEAAARAYADALEENRLEAARALSTGLDADQFAKVYADAGVRAERAREVRAAADGAQGVSSLKLVLENGAWRVQELEPAKPQVQQAAADVLVRFLDAAEAGNFEAALGLLGAQWRNRYTPKRFEEDFAKEPLAKERLQRARSALANGTWVVDAAGAQLKLGEGRAVRLAKEGDAYRVAALE